MHNTSPQNAVALVCVVYCFYAVTNGHLHLAKGTPVSFRSEHHLRRLIWICGRPIVHQRNPCCRVGIVCIAVVVLSYLHKHVILLWRRCKTGALQPRRRSQTLEASWLTETDRAECIATYQCCTVLGSNIGDQLKMGTLKRMLPSSRLPCATLSNSASHQPPRKSCK